MENDEIKTLADALKELNENYIDVIQTMKETTKEVKATKQLWRKGNNSILIKLGLALIAFPDPTISDIIGTVLVAAGTVQMGIRRRTIYVEDVYKTFHSTLKDMWAIKRNV
jgi:methyl-accepting chemotaxis protein